ADAFDRNTPAPHPADAALASAGAGGCPRSASAPACPLAGGLSARPAQLKRRGRPPAPADARPTFGALRYAAVISTHTSPAPTQAPATARTLVTRPATSAASVLSIFIASRTTSA